MKPKMTVVVDLPVVFLPTSTSALNSVVIFCSKAGDTALWFKEEQPVKTTREATDKSFKDEDRLKDITILIKNFGFQSYSNNNQIYQNIHLI
jgi:hypothetical protein